MDLSYLQKIFHIIDDLVHRSKSLKFPKSARSKNHLIFQTNFWVFVHKAKSYSSDLQVDTAISAWHNSHEAIFSPVRSPAIFDEPIAFEVPPVKQDSVVQGVKF
jgi:hypothetical protein